MSHREQATTADLAKLQHASFDYFLYEASYKWKRLHGQEHLYARPLLTHQLSHIRVALRGIQHAFMRENGIDHFENSRRATYVQQEYAIDNPLKFEAYGRDCWGVTASEGPGPKSMRVNGIERQFFDYVGRGVPDEPDDGTIAPWAVVASLPFAPEIVSPSLGYKCEAPAPSAGPRPESRGTRVRRLPEPTKRLTSRRHSRGRNCGNNLKIRSGLHSGVGRIACL